MREYRASLGDIYYTKDHEWISFQASLAFTGVCGFKLTGIKEIHQFIIGEALGLKKQGEKIGTIQYNDYLIDVNMPVSGYVLEINSELLSGNVNLLVQQPEKGGWIARINPLQPDDRGGLLLPEEYIMKVNGKIYQ